MKQKANYSDIIYIQLFENESKEILTKEITIRILKKNLVPVYKAVDGDINSVAIFKKDILRVWDIKEYSILDNQAITISDEKIEKILLSVLHPHIFLT